MVQFKMGDFQPEPDIGDEVQITKASGLRNPIWTTVEKCNCRYNCTFHFRERDKPNVVHVFYDFYNGWLGDGIIHRDHESDRVQPDQINDEQLKIMNLDGRERCARCGEKLVTPYTNCTFCPVCEG